MKVSPKVVLDQIDFSGLNSAKSKSNIDEYGKLHNNILDEINERYKRLEDYERAGDNKNKLRVMNEIKERISDLKTLNKLKDA